MTRRPTGGWPHDWRRPAVTVAALVLLVAGYPAAPWAPNIPAPNEILGIAVGYSDHSYGSWFARDGVVLAVIPAGSAEKVERIEREAQPPNPGTSVSFDFDPADFQFRLTRNQLEDLGGFTTKIDGGVISLRPITTGRYLSCIVEEDQHGILATGCSLRHFQVPGWVEW